jgi:hypothetical protein
MSRSNGRPGCADDPGQHVGVRSWGVSERPPQQRGSSRGSEIPICGAWPRLPRVAARRAASAAPQRQALHDQVHSSRRRRDDLGIDGRPVDRRRPRRRARRERSRSRPGAGQPRGRAPGPGRRLSRFRSSTATVRSTCPSSNAARSTRRCWRCSFRKARARSKASARLAVTPTPSWRPSAPFRSAIPTARCWPFRRRRRGRRQGRQARDRHRIPQRLSVRRQPGADRRLLPRRRPQLRLRARGQQRLCRLLAAQRRRAQGRVGRPVAVGQGSRRQAERPGRDHRRLAADARRRAAGAGPDAAPRWSPATRASRA